MWGPLKTEDIQIFLEYMYTNLSENFTLNLRLDKKDTLVLNLPLTLKIYHRPQLNFDQL